MLALFKALLFDVKTYTNFLYETPNQKQDCLSSINYCSNSLVMIKLKL